MDCKCCHMVPTEVLPKSLGFSQELLPPCAFNLLWVADMGETGELKMEGKVRLNLQACLC
jgi:hypothetical protein